MLFRSRSMFLGFAAVCVCVTSAVAMGDGTAVWVELDNSVNPANGNPTGLDDGAFDGTVYRSFDLYVALLAPWFSEDSAQNSVTAVDFGLGGQNTGLVSDGLYLQVPVLGGDLVSTNETFVDFDDRVYFDCAVAIEDSPISFTGFGWDAGSVHGAWFVSTGQGVFAPDGQHVFVARVTVSADASELGGQCFVVDDRQETCPELCHPIPSLYVHDIPNAFRELACLGDINWDGMVDVADLGSLISSFGSGWGDAGFNPRCDFTRDGVVDTADLARLIANYGKLCE